jgi:hypothetical protein
MLRRSVFRPLEHGKLQLSKLRLGINSAISIAKGLKKQNSLFYIDLSNNMISDIGVVAICQLAMFIILNTILIIIIVIKIFIRTLTNIVYFNVESNDITDEGCVSVGRLLSSNTSSSSSSSSFNATVSSSSSPEKEKQHNDPSRRNTLQSKNTYNNISSVDINKGNKSLQNTLNTTQNPASYNTIEIALFGAAKGAMHGNSIGQNGFF